MLLYDILIEGIEIDVLCSLFIAERALIPQHYYKIFFLST